VVALGDSVPRGTGCDCTPYPPLTADGLMETSGQAVTAANDAVGGYTTEDVLRRLGSNSDVIDRVRAADVVEIEVGANDVGYSKSGASGSAASTRLRTATPTSPRPSRSPTT
jgi:lysophospholipase L1-like esterase